MGVTSADARATRLRAAARVRRIAIAQEAALITTGIVLYFLVRGLMENRVPLAFRNADQVIEFERWAGLFVEPRLQSAAAEHNWLVDTMNYVRALAGGGDGPGLATAPAP